jgi:cytoskeleton protein RodZ
MSIMALESISQATLPQDELTAILNQIESELYCTKVYRTALGILKQRLGESAEGSSLLLQAVAKKAIWLTLKQWVSPDQDPPEPLNESGFGEALDFPSRCDDRPELQALEDIRTPESHPHSAPVKPGPVPQKPATPLFQKVGIPPFQRQPQWTAVERAAQIMAQKQEWANRLTQIGQQLQAARCSHGLSILDLHKQTLIPYRHLEAIENGILDQLPEDVFVRSFIHKIGNLLGLDGVRLAQSLPVPPKEKMTPASGHSLDLSLGFAISPLHLYLGYTALMAGAIGGLGLMTDPSSPRPIPEPDPVLTAPAREGRQSQVPIQTPGMTAHGAIACAISEIAPPEALEW